MFSGCGIADDLARFVDDPCDAVHAAWRQLFGEKCSPVHVLAEPLQEDMSPTRYGYRNDPGVPRFPDDKGVLVFDGVCVLCTGFARYVLRHDRYQRIRPCPAQSRLGQALYRHYGLDPLHYETNIFIKGGLAYFKSEAFIAAMATMGWPHSIVRGFRICPRFIRDLAYGPVARNRYRWFGERKACYVPDANERDRFLA